MSSGGDQSSDANQFSLAPAVVQKLQGKSGLGTVGPTTKMNALNAISPGPGQNHIRDNESDDTQPQKAQ